MASPVLVIGIAGGTASGKSTVTKRIIEGLSETLDSSRPETDLASFIRDERPTKTSGSVVMLDQDSYYREFSDLPIEEKRQINWDHPDAFDADLMVSHIRALKSGEPVEKPIYRFDTYSREATSATIRPGPVLVV